MYFFGSWPGDGQTDEEVVLTISALVSHIILMSHFTVVCTRWQQRRHSYKLIHCHGRWGIVQVDQKYKTNSTTARRVLPNQISTIYFKCRRDGYRRTSSNI